MIRNDKVEWILGYSKVLGAGTSLSAKAWAIQSGLQIATNTRIKKNRDRNRLLQGSI